MHGVATNEWDIRVDLAAAHRLAALCGWTDLIFNHFTVRVPGEHNRFLIKRHSLLFEEVTASNLVKIDIDGTVVGTDVDIKLVNDDVNRAGFIIHSAVFKARPDVNAVMHVHSQPGMAIAARKGGLLFIAQDAMKFYNRLSYHDFEGFALDVDECERIGRDLGRNKAMILRNHGLLTCGAAVSDAILDLRMLILVAEAQLQIEATGAEITQPPPEVCEKTAQQFEAMEAKDGTTIEWAAVRRWLDTKDPSYRL